ncbi:PQQ-binding-like beta-propeller repeat protein [Maridesulfovibrio sp.]|uniref:PQQ-binding-like beta-propeller repeat protein n=1 Tax=Maridesulfovibrio sp. TaxID=2795000 RepID=UPI0029C9E768|nr:PQQ-binding-like beta-propeller repeat protein [Maridesulfovibrio sp.]
MNRSSSTCPYRHNLTLTALSLIAVLSMLLGFASIGMAAGSLKWSFSKRSSDVFSPAIGNDGTIYVGCDDRNLYALEPGDTDCTEKWSYPTGGEIYSAPTIGSDGTIYTGSSDGKLYAVNSDGSKKWIYNAGSIMSFSAAISSDGTIYIESTDGKLHAVNSDGSGNWIYDTEHMFTSAPVIGPDGTVYVTTTDDNLYAIKPDGTLKWTFKAGDRIEYSPAIDSNGVIYFGSSGSCFYALNPDKTLKWKIPVDSVITSSPAIGSGGVIYLGTAGNLYALNSDGSEKWKYEADGAVRSPAIASDGTIYVWADNNILCAIKSSGARKWFLDIGSSSTTGTLSPAIGSDGSIYVNIYPGMADFVALQAREGDSGGLADTDWPRSQKDNQNTGASKSGDVSPSETQADGISVSISASVTKEMDSTDLSTQYHSGGFTPKSKVDSFNATLNVNGGCATFKISSTNIPTGKVSDLALMKFYNTNGTSKEYSRYALTGPEYNIDGYWWVTDADGNHMARTDDTTLGTEYYIYFVIKDNGNYDENRDLGKITDPVAVGTGSSSGSGTGCTLNPQATFSVEWLLLMLVPMLLPLRARFKR